jgi:putative restriction endonuclease
MPETRSYRTWTEDELVKVLSLYCQLPFGQMHSRNLAVVRFARALERTPASIALKLVNFASFDPGLRARGIRGMSNASRLDRIVWDRFYGNWETLASIEDAERVVTEQLPARRTAAERMTLVRLGQGFFRNAVLAGYELRCCITGIEAPELLRASHIIPWSVSEARRLDPANGVCLNALHDAAFDAGLIGVDEQLRIMVSRSTRDSMPEEVFDDYFSRYQGKRIRTAERFAPDAECLRYHRENVFMA